jgi:hypothetical protein
MNPSLVKYLNMLGFVTLDATERQEFVAAASLKVVKGKNKRGAGGLGKPPAPLKWRRRGKDLAVEPNPFPRKEEKSTIKIL